MQVPEDQCPDPRVRHANFIYFSGLLDRGLFTVGCLLFIMKSSSHKAVLIFGTYFKLLIKS